MAEERFISTCDLSSSSSFSISSPVSMASDDITDSDNSSQGFSPPPMPQGGPLLHVKSLRANLPSHKRSNGFKVITFNFIFLYFLYIISVLFTERWKSSEVLGLTDQLALEWTDYLLALNDEGITLAVNNKDILIWAGGDHSGAFTVKKLL